MYWTIGSFPELDHLEPHERAQILKRVPRALYFSIIWRYALLGAILGLPLAWATVSFRTRDMATPMIVFFVIVFAVTGYVYELKRMRRSLRQTIAEAFRGQTLPFCMSCGYDLRAAVGEECPECGAAVVAK